MTILKTADTTEPAINTGVNVTGVAGVVSVLVAVINHFYPNLISDSLISAVVTIAMFILPMITGLLIRRKVWSPASVQKAVKAASDGYDILQQVKDFPLKTPTVKKTQYPPLSQED